MLSLLQGTPGDFLPHHPSNSWNPRAVSACSSESITPTLANEGPVSSFSCCPPGCKHPQEPRAECRTRRTPSTSKNHHGAGQVSSHLPLTSFNLSHLRLNKDEHPPLPSSRGRGRHRSNAFLGLSCVFSLLRGCPSTCAFGNAIKLGYHTTTMPDT